MSRLSVFVGMAASDTLRPEQADVLDFFGYAAGGAHRPWPMPACSTSCPATTRTCRA